MWSVVYYVYLEQDCAFNLIIVPNVFPSEIVLHFGERNVLTICV